MDGACDVIELNVGGRQFITTRQTLTTGGGLLAGMFSGSFGGLPRDANGRIFLDFDPDCFEVLFNHLRLLQLTGLPSACGALAAPARKEAMFAALLQYLGLVGVEEFIP